MVRSIRAFKQELQALGFHKLPKRGKGDHEIWHHAEANVSISLDGKGSDDVHQYNEKQLREAKAKLDRAQGPKI